MNLQQARDWSDLALKLCSIAAIFLAGAWALVQFQVTGLANTNIQLTVTTDVLPYSAGTRLLVVHARPKNIGKVPVDIVKTSFPIIVRALPSAERVGPVVLSNLHETFKTDLLQRFPEGYLLEPGVEYDEIFPIVVKRRCRVETKLGQTTFSLLEAVHTSTPDQDPHRWAM